MKEKLKLIIEFTKRDIKEKYIGTSFGQLWLLISPLITIIIYTVIFSDFMKMKLNIIDSKYAYSIYLIPGLLSWNYFSSLVLRLSNSIYEKAHILKKISIPMYVYYISITISESIIYVIGILLGIVFLLLVGHHIDYTMLFFPFYMLLITMFGFSLGVVLSLFTPFFRDLKEIINIVLQLWFWMTPIIYVKDLIYHKYPILVDINPIYYFIEPMQNIFLHSKILYKDTFISIVILSVVFMIAIWLYKKLINEIKDII